MALAERNFTMEVLVSNPIPNGATVMQEMVLIRNMAARKAVNVVFTIPNTVLPQLLTKLASLKTALWFTLSELNGENLKSSKREHTGDQIKQKISQLNLEIDDLVSLHVKTRQILVVILLRLMLYRILEIF